MSNEIQPYGNTAVAPANDTRTIEVNRDIGTFVAQANEVNANTYNTYNNLVINSPAVLAEALREYFKGSTPMTNGDPNAPAQAAPPAPQPIPVTHAIEWAGLDAEHYCLFVLENEEYNNGAFSIAKSLALTKYTEEAELNQYRSLNEQAVQALTSMPCIFAKRNLKFGMTSKSHPAVLGRIREIHNQGRTVKFIFEGFQAVSQQLLNQHVQELEIYRASMRNEFDEEHWSIKQCNLQQVITDIGIEIK